MLVPPAVLCPPGGPLPCSGVPPCGGRLLPPPCGGFWPCVPVPPFGVVPPCGGFWPCVPVPPFGVVPSCGVVRVRAFSPLTRLDPAMSQTPLPFDHRLHAPSARYGSGPPYAYGSCGAPPEQAYLGTGSHRHHTPSGQPDAPAKWWVARVNH